MAKVHAAKTLETMLDVTSERTGIGRSIQQRRQPGLQIVILPAIQPQVPLIEATPAPEAEPVLPSDLE
jgi:hypothetical protein